MSGLSVYTAQAMINHLLRGQAFTPPANRFLALFVADPTDNNITANEIAAAWYARQPIDSWSAPTGSGTATDNSNQVVYGVVTGNAVTSPHWGIYDALVNGNLLLSGPWAEPKVLNVDDIPVINAGELDLDFQ